MTPCSYTELIDAFMTCGIERVLRSYFGSDSCINSTRVLLEICRAYGLAADGFPVRTQVFSRAFMQRAHREGRLPEDHELRSWCAQPGVWSVGIGYGTPEMDATRWPGHLVLRAGRSYLIDATISQASRPARGIAMPDMLVIDAVPPEFWRGHGIVTADTPDGSWLRYEPDLGNTYYLHSPGWALRPGVEAAAYQEILLLLQTSGGLPATRRKEGAA